MSETEEGNTAIVILTPLILAFLGTGKYGLLEAVAAARKLQIQLLYLNEN